MLDSTVLGLRRGEMVSLPTSSKVVKGLLCAHTYGKGLRE
jgi:hypothetical protein